MRVAGRRLRRAFRRRIIGKLPSLEERADGYHAVEYVSAQSRLDADSDGDLLPGLNCCAVCCKDVLQSCMDCGRISYCGDECQRIDAIPHRNVCARLAECEAQALDELAVEETLLETNVDRTDEAEMPGSEAFGAWRDAPSRVAMSFPLSAAWALSHIRDRPLAHIQDAGTLSHKRGGLVLDAPAAMAALHRAAEARIVHVVGVASPECCAPAQWWAAALLASGAAQGDYHFDLIGPTAPAKAAEVADVMGVRVHLAFHRRAYEDFAVETPRNPDVVVGFNLGLTDVAYAWQDALAAVAKRTPFVFFTSSRLEAKRERRFLREHGSAVASTFRLNPFRAPAWRQSGQQANDTYQKHSRAMRGTF